MPHAQVFEVLLIEDKGEASNDRNVRDLETGMNRLPK